MAYTSIDLILNIFFCNPAEKYEFPSGVVKPESSLTTAVTDIRGDKCQETIAYICDLHGNALIVFDLANRTSWRIQHNFFYPWPNRGTLTISGITFDLMDPVFGLALGKFGNTFR